MSLWIFALVLRWGIHGRLTPGHLPVDAGCGNCLSSTSRLGDFLERILHQESFHNLGLSFAATSISWEAQEDEIAHSSRATVSMIGSPREFSNHKNCPAGLHSRKKHCPVGSMIKSYAANLSPASR